MSDKKYVDFLRKLSVAESLVDCLGILNPIVGDYYPSVNLRNWYGTFTDLPANQLRAIYYPVFRKTRFNQIGMRLVGAGGVGALLRLGVYDDLNFYPRSRLFDSGDLDGTATGDKTAALDLTLDAGRYWVIFLHNDGTMDFPYTEQSHMPSMFDLRQAFQHYIIAQAYGALPATFPAGAAKWIYSFHIFLRVAAVF